MTATGPNAHRGTLSFGQVHPGDRLPELRVDVTASLIVAGAIASRDFQDVHHDEAAARAAGARDIFMNIHTTNGLVGRFVTDWAGPEALLKRVSIRLGAPNHPGDTMVLTGEVVEARDGEVEVAIRGRNGVGDHVIGTVALSFPKASA